MPVELRKIQEALIPAKEKIVQHKAYKVIYYIEDIRVLMRFQCMQCGILCHSAK